MHLEIIRSIAPLNSLRYKELDVLGEILYWNHVYRETPVEDRWKLVFNYDTKINMMDHIFMDTNQFNNCLTSLRKKGILKGKSIISTFGVSPEHSNITVNFKIS